MEQEMIQIQEPYDYREYDRIWRKVAPDLNPYPQARLESDGEMNLPGAEEDPCCMGTEAMESVGVLEGFVREELCTQRLFNRIAAHCRNMELRGILLEFAAAAAKRAKKLLSVLYLITGQPYCPEVSCEQKSWSNYCELLRMLYHGAACSGFNYARAAQETLDPCLQKLLKEFSEQEYCRANRILELLAKTL